MPIVSSSGITGTHESPKALAPGVVTGRYGTIGEVFFVQEAYWPLNTTLYVEDFKGNDPRFVAYLLESLRFDQLVASSAVPGINRNHLHPLPVSVPPVAVQEEISSVIGGVDDLIEINCRRIEVLEEVARLLYREWFIDFRFPGHENVDMVESELGPIPEGWAVKRLDQAAEVVDCSHAKKPVESDTGRPLLHVWNVGQTGRLDLSKTFLVGDTDYGAWTKRFEARPGDCIITKTGRVGAVAQIPEGTTAALGRNLVGLRMAQFPCLLHGYLLSATKEREVKRLQWSGTIMESLPVKAVEALRMPVPTPGIATQFEEVVTPVRGLWENLAKQIEALTQTRDLLLPRLVSGELDVSELDLDAVVGSVV